mgnify:CR=1 FL=1|jgi:hypothetical protein
MLTVFTEIDGEGNVRAHAEITFQTIPDDVFGNIPTTVGDHFRWPGGLFPGLWKIKRSQKRETGAFALNYAHALVVHAVRVDERDRQVGVRIG